MYAGIIIWIFVLLTGWIYLATSDIYQNTTSVREYHIQTQFESNHKNIAINKYKNREYWDSKTDEFMKIIDGYDLVENPYLQWNNTDKISWTILENSKYDIDNQTDLHSQDTIHSQSTIDFWLYRVDIQEENIVEWWDLIDDL